MDVFRQDVLSHRRFYINDNNQVLVLHRDISLLNFKCYEVIGKWKGALIDYDLATTLRGSKGREPEMQRRTGTAAFMTRELMACEPQDNRTYLRS